jgi:hypothetical protein
MMTHLLIRKLKKDLAQEIEDHKATRAELAVARAELELIKGVMSEANAQAEPQAEPQPEAQAEPQPEAQAEPQPEAQG